MQRRSRLQSPAVAFSVIGLVGLYAASVPGLFLRGGLVGNGVYLLALQLVVSALAMSATGDSPDPHAADRGRERWWRTKGSASDTAASRLRDALWHFHVRRPLAAGLLALGLSISLSFIAIGVLDRGLDMSVADQSASALGGVRASEVALGSLLVLTVLLTLGWRGPGRYGWVVGFAVGVVMTQVSLNVSPDDGKTAANWALLGAALLTCLLLSTVADAVLSRRRREQPA